MRPRPGDAGVIPSRFSVETQTLLRKERLAAAALYVGLSVVGGVAAALIGFVAGWAVTACTFAIATRSALRSEVLKGMILSSLLIDWSRL